MQQNINQAVTILKRGGLVAFATETVYGLGADAKNPAAVQKIFTAKQRPANFPLNVLISDVSQLSQWAIDIPQTAYQLAKEFWPGPLTLILKKAPQVLDIVTHGKSTIGLRIPDHPQALELLKQFGSGLAAPSANRFGHLSPTTALAVREELGDAVDLILDGGQCELGMESTIVDLSGDQPVILRSGMISIQKIEQVLQHKIAVVEKESHLQLDTPIKVISNDELIIFLEKLTDFPVALLTMNVPAIPAGRGIVWVKMPSDPGKYAHDLYQILRELDKKQLKQIVIEAVPDADEWRVVSERMRF